MNLIIQTGTGGVRKVPVLQGLLTIGRGEDCDLVLQDPLASRHHAELRRFGDGWLIIDLGSTNGTLLDGRPLQPREANTWIPGQSITIGHTSLTLQAGASSAGDGWAQVTHQQPMGPSYQPQAAWEAKEEAGAPSLVLTVTVWLARLLVAAGAGLLLAGGRSDWIRLRVQVPLLGTVVDRTFDGLDSGYGWLLIGLAALALVLLLVDLLARHWGSTTGLAQALLGALTAILLAVSGYTYYQAGSQTVLGISMIDVLTQYARNVVSISIQPGLYLIGGGLGGLILGGLLRLVTAGFEPRAS